MTRLLVMAKAPLPGMTKTRLRLPPERATSLQAALISDTVERARFFGPVTVAGTPLDDLTLIRPLLPDGVRLVAQTGGDLGEKMLTTVRRLFDEDPEPVLILGTDAPTLPPESIRRAAHVLEGHYAASIVGSADGGYVLLGLKEPHGVLFRAISWSTDIVYRETITKARTHGISIHEGEPHYDVDTPEDLARLEKELGETPELAPNTAKFLKSL
jgi:rSAM/selenodomain-associated transferase 1